MARVLGIPIILAAGIFLAALVNSIPQDSKITRFDSPDALKKFIVKISNSELRDLMNSEETEGQETVVKSPNSDKSGESASLESSEDEVKKNSTTAIDNPNSEETLFHHLFGGVNKELANVFSMLAKNSANQLWWRGENVCIEREEIVEKTNETDIDAGLGQFNQLFTFGAAQFSSCRQTPSKYICTTNTHKRGETKTSVVTYQCCYGFRRIDNKGQCTKVELKPMLDLMNEIGGQEFMKMVQNSDVNDMLESKNVTLFVPNDDAVREYENEILATNNIRLRRRVEDFDALSNSDKQVLSPNEMILSHVIPKLVDTYEISNEEILYSENQNSTIRMNVYPGEKEPIVTANCAEVKSANNPSTAGLIHIISKVMKPVEKTLMQMINEEPSLSMFKQMLDTSNLTAVLEEHPHLTIFAPNNAAFEKMESGLRSKYLRGEACIKSVLKHHIVPHTICSSAIGNKKRSTIDMNSEWLVLEREESGTLVVGEKAHTEKSDLMATNGVMHIVNKVIQPKSAQQTSQILSQSNHTKWLELVQKANLLDMLDQSSNMTFFVPSEAALNEPEMMEKLSQMNTEELRDLVLYHSAQPKICSCELESDMVVNSTLQGQKIQINVYNSIPMFNGLEQRATVQCAKLINADEKGCETVAHEIESVIFPPTQSTLEYIKSNPNLTIMSQILEGTKILTELSEGSIEPFTLLAPTDDTFKNVLEPEMKTLKEDKEMADAFIRKHLLEDHVCCSSIGPVVWPFVNEVSNLAGGSMELRRDAGGKVHFNSAIATNCDNIVKDGVIHLINKPLLPRSSTIKNGSVKFTDPSGMQVLLFGV